MVRPAGSDASPGPVAEASVIGRIRSATCCMPDLSASRRCKREDSSELFVRRLGPATPEPLCACTAASCVLEGLRHGGWLGVGR